MDKSSRNETRSAAAEWKKALVSFVTGLFAFESLTGLLIYFGPFSLSNQFAVLLHTVVGILWLVPYAVYQWTHWRGVRSQRLSHFKLIGYVTWVAITVCGVSGIVLTVEATWGTRIGYPWRLTHIVSCFASLALVITHVMTVLVAHLRTEEMESGPQMRGAQRVFFVKTGGALAAMLVAWLGAFALYRPVDTHFNFPADYSYRYGKDRPFAPSLSRTATGGAIHPRTLADSESCGDSGCHVEVVKEWIPSAHRYSSMDPLFQIIQKVMAKNEGAESTRYCAGCHDPVALFSGSKNIYEKDLTSYGANEGVSCLVCHSIEKTDVKGNADYVIAEQKRYAFELKEGKTNRFLANFLIRAYPDHHIGSYSRPFYKTPEYCAACHKQFIDQEINKVGWVQLQNQYDNWKASHWSTGRTGNDVITCRECHMPLAEHSGDPASGDSADYNRSPSDGKHRSHRFLGANQFVPGMLKLPGWEKHAALIESWLQGKVPIHEIEKKWANGAAVDLKIEAPEVAHTGSEFVYKVVVHSNKVGHDFPTGPLDIIQAWVETEVIDDSGRVIYESGRLDANHFLPKEVFLFKAEGIDKFGNLIDRHNLWEMIGARFRRSLFPGFTDAAEYRFLCPDMPRLKGASRHSPSDETHKMVVPATAGQLRISAKVRYRKVDQFLLNYALGPEAKVTAPVTDMSQVEQSIPVLLAATSARK
ncbi:MAG TPA: multiheme c-type cytochrome [Bdellovibrionota bacterium]|nr:multiheme c-type cytochrome [Bdellovibrionota bacterium]